MDTLLTIDDLLFNACSNPSSKVEGYNEYRIDLHCKVFKVTAKLIGYTPDPHRRDQQRPQYLIHCYTMED